MFCLFVTLMFLTGSCTTAASADNTQGTVSAADYASIQAAIDANPGKTVHLADRVYELTAAVRIKDDGTSLAGPGKLVQNNPEARILDVDKAKDVRIRDLILTRREGKQDANCEAFYGFACDGLVLENVKAIDNRAGKAAVLIENSGSIRVDRCEVLNYKAIRVDDRLNSELYRYSFRCINGAGIQVRNCRSVHLLYNRVVERNLLPTQETAKRYDLGRVLAKADKPVKFTPAGNYTGGWHQGSAIEVKGPTVACNTLVQGNYIENAAQGMDIHADTVIILGNHVNTSHTGIKTMHGGRHVLISNNIIERADDEGIYLGSGTGYGYPPGKQPPVMVSNNNNGCIVSNNVISDMGHGIESWALWKRGVKAGSPLAIKIHAISYYGELIRDDILVMGNMVYDSGIYGIVKDGSVVTGEPPHYKYAVWIEPEAVGKIKRLRFVGNIFHPGELGISNTSLERYQ